MTTVLCHFRVADYDAWRRGYDHALQVTPGVRSFRAWRAQDDPSLVMVEETFDTREQAQAAWTSAETQAAMEADGIDMSSVWVDVLRRGRLGVTTLDACAGCGAEAARTRAGWRSSGRPTVWF